VPRLTQSIVDGTVRSSRTCKNGRHARRCLALRNFFGRRRTGDVGQRMAGLLQTACNTWAPGTNAPFAERICQRGDDFSRNRQLLQVAGDVRLTPTLLSRHRAHVLLVCRRPRRRDSDGSDYLHSDNPTNQVAARYLHVRVSCRRRAAPRLSPRCSTADIAITFPTCSPWVGNSHDDPVNYEVQIAVDVGIGPLSCVRARRSQSGQFYRVNQTHGRQFDSTNLPRGGV
jgi:hypothetical protein